MDNILNKDIFHDQDLYKLSPDYKPVNVLLRMQLRRNLAKDSHSHNHNRLKNPNWTRKSIKKKNDCYNINKDIVKLQHDFNHMNLKNRLTLKCLDPVKTKHDAGNDFLNDCVGDSIEDLFLHEFVDDQTELAICNDTDLKLNMKTKCAKAPKQIRNYQKKDLNPISNKGHALDEDIFDNNEDIFKIECLYSNRNVENKSVDAHKVIEVAETERSSKNDLKRDTSLINVDTQRNDLQKLLIMMAISSKPNNSDDAEEANLADTFQDENILHAQDNSCLLSPNSREIETILSVTPIRVEINEKEKVFARKYVDKWKQYVCNRKKHITAQRQAALNNFFDKITKKKMDLNQGQETENKAKHNVRDYTNYQHRYKVQKHIIALQKAKLDEQNRLIEELKYNKIIEASRQSVDMMREEVRKSYYEIDRQLKPKIKCLTNELKIHDIEEQSLVLHCLKVPQFLQRMEKRAREREEKHALIRERRRQMEEERVRLKQQAELARAEMDKEEKIKRMKELKEKRKREKIENIRRKQFAERLRGLIVMADLHYEKTLMAKYGIRPLRMLMELRRDNIEMARAHYKFQLMKNVFLQWMWYTEDMWFERNFKAEELYRKKLLKKTIEGFKINHHGYILKRQVAEDYYDFYVTKLAFRKLREGVAILKKEHEGKWKTAVVYHNSNIIFKAFTCWRTLPVLNALQRVQEARKARWREKVLLVVPDYTPPED